MSGKMLDGAVSIRRVFGARWKRSLRPLCLAACMVVPASEAQAALLVSGQSGIWTVKVDGGTVYFVTGDLGATPHYIKSVPTTGGAITDLVTINPPGQPGDQGARTFLYDADNFYGWWGGYAPGHIWSAPRSGGTATYLLTGISGGAPLGQDANRLFYYSGFSSPIRAIDKDGTNASTVGGNCGWPRSNAEDDTHIYCQAYSSHDYSKISKSDGATTSLGITGTNEFPIAVDSNYLYVSDRSGNASIEQYTKDGTFVATLVDRSGSEATEAEWSLSSTDDTNYYFYDPETASISSVPVSGGAVTALAPIPRPDLRAFTVVDDVLYYVDHGNGPTDHRIYSLSLEADCGNGALEPGEECESPFGNCCEPTTCQFRSSGESCASDDNPCTTDLCDGAGACVHAAGNPGTVCRPSGQSPACAPESLPAGAIELPLGISKDWFLTHECGAEELMVFPTASEPCNAWHTYTEAPATAAKLGNIVNGLTADIFSSPETTAGVTYYNFVGGTIESQTSRIKDLFDSKKSGGVWTPLIAVYEGGCSNVSGAQKVVGFATARVTGVQTSPSPFMKFSIDCDIIELGTPGGPNDFGTLVTPCADCDIAESCDGLSTECPVDAKEPAGTSCVASGPEYAYPCGSETCDDSGVCDYRPISSGLVCREAVGACDLAESCDGSSYECPMDSFLATTVTCRTAMDACDLAETCTGSGADCPVDAFQPSSAVCREATGSCDVVEFCTGASASCPADSVQGASTVCRAAAGVCDVEELCTGSSPACPVDAVLSSATICRSASGVCDLDENCTGSSAACPADQLRSSATTCRMAAGVCDSAETCSGTSADCPADERMPTSTVCRASNGSCDVAESCDGTGNACPTDAFVADGESCAGIDDECAVATCDGSGGCVVDNLPAGTACGSNTATECTLADTCDGAGNCDTNDVLDGTPCGDTCAGAGTCTAGSCSGMPVECDDGNPCTQDSCDPDDGSCVFAVEPATGCRSAGNSGLQFSTGGDGKARWKWQKGQATSCDEFGAPDLDTDLDVCVYDGVGAGQYALATSFHLPANPFWEASSQCRWSYVDKSAGMDGIRKFALTPGTEGRSAIALGAAGPLTPLPTPVATDRFLRMDPDVTVQMYDGSGECWESEFTKAYKNTATRFKTKLKVLVTN